MAPFRFSSASADGSVSVIAALPLIGIHLAYVTSVLLPEMYHATITTPPLSIIVCVGVRFLEKLTGRPRGRLDLVSTSSHPVGLASVLLGVVEVHGHARMSWALSPTNV